MTNTKLLFQAIKEAGYLRSYVAEKCGITYLSFYNKAHNKTSFTPPEIQAVRNVLGLTLERLEEIFFAEDVEETSTEAESEEE